MKVETVALITLKDWDSRINTEGLNDYKVEEQEDGLYVMDTDSDTDGDDSDTGTNSDCDID